jgi:predicted dehydrogenase
LRILVGGEWIPGYLDYYRRQDAVRVAVSAIVNLERIAGLYFEPSASLRLLWNYVRSAGLLEVIRKVRSRRGERGRNQKFVSCGLGTLLEAPPSLAALLQEPVVFLATAHPACAERLVIDAALVRAAPAELRVPATDRRQVLHLPAHGDAEPWWRPVAGWTRDAGTAIDPATAGPLLDCAVHTLGQAQLERARRLAPAEDQRISTERRPIRTQPARGGKPAVAIVGFGNYAKTMIVPNIRHHLDVRVVHELDPTQVSPGTLTDCTVSSAPEVAPEPPVTAVIAAGFHHTHAATATAALRQGRYAVSEKPLATTWEQLGELAAAVREHGKYFAGFQRRYLAFNGWVETDLGVRPGDPVSYHCIVYEVPLPARHWYRWPASGSRLLSNGCHWIDHFLFLNRFASPVAAAVFTSGDEAVNVSVSLENGALFTMALTDRGSPRIGLRDYVELRAGRATVRILDAAEYEAESPTAVRRRVRHHKYDGHRRMYRTIARKIAGGAAGDPPEWTLRSAELVLRLEDELGTARSAIGAA